MADDLIIYGGRGNSKPFVSINALTLLLENRELKAKVDILNGEIKILKSNRLNMFEHLDIVQENNKLKQTLTEIKPILEFYANSKMGEEQPDGTYKIILSGGYVMAYDPKPARQALQKISEVENEV